MKILNSVLSQSQGEKIKRKKLLCFSIGIFINLLNGLGFIKEKLMREAFILMNHYSDHAIPNFDIAVVESLTESDNSFLLKSPPSNVTPYFSVMVRKWRRFMRMCAICLKCRKQGRSISHLLANIESWVSGETSYTSPVSTLSKRCSL